LFLQWLSSSSGGTAVLDEIDRAILAALLTNGRVSFRELSERIHLSPNAIAERIRRLQRVGVIAAVRAELDLTALGRPLLALLDIRLVPGTRPEHFERTVRHLLGVLDAVHVTGDFDYQLRVACRDANDLDDLVRRLKEQAGVRDSAIRIVLRQVDVDATLTLLGPEPASR